MTDVPLVSVVIPARNEAADIERCIDAVLAQDWPQNRLEVIVVDGASTDGTADIARDVLARSAVAWKVLENPAGSTPTNLNQGLAEATGDYLCRVDARSLVRPSYVSTCVEVLELRPEVAVVGGAQIARVPDGVGAIARGIARCLRNPYTTGFARYRRGATSGPTDTVYLGFFRTAQVRAAGGWDERFVTNQDYELNRRMGERGIVWFDDRLVVGYRPRPTLGELWSQYRRFGRWKAASWIEGGVRMSQRQMALLAMPPVAAVAGLLALRRRPLSTAAVGVVALAALDAQSPGPASPAERGAASLAACAVAAAWWIGVLEQSTRRLRGERLLP